MKALIIEDSQLARRELLALLQSHADIEVIGECSNADEAEVSIGQCQPDIVFLDIHMPGRSGFDLLEDLQVKPEVIFTTAHIDYAVRSFDYDPIDYLVKPIHPKKLARAINRAQEKMGGTEQTDKNDMLKMDESIFVRDGEKCHLIPLRNIERFDSHGNYCRIHFIDSEKKTAKNVFIYKSLAKVETRLPSRHFFRNNRQQIINVTCVTNVEVWVNGGLRVTLKSGTETEVSRRNTSKFKQLFSI